MKKILISPKENMIEKIAEYIISCNSIDLDYSEATVVFPNKRPKYFLLKYLGEKISKPFFPPHIISMDEFIDETFALISPDYKNLTIIESVYLLFEIFQKYPDFAEEIENRDLLNDFESFFPFGLKIFECFEELKIEDVQSQIFKYYESLISFYAFLSKVYEEFYSTLETKKFSTRAFKYWRVSKDLNPHLLSRTKRFLLCGFHGLTKTEKEIIAKINDFFEKQYNSEAFSQWQYFDEQNLSHKPHIEIIESPDRHGQIFMLNHLLSDNILEEKTLIVLPSEDLLFPLLKNVISRFEEDKYNISMGYPIIRTPLWSLFETISNFLYSMFEYEKNKYLIPVREYLKFILHPYVKNIFFEKDSTVTRILFHSIEDYLTEQEAAGVLLEDMEEIIIEKVYSQTEELKKYSLFSLKKHIKKIHQVFIRDFFQIKDLKDFSYKCINILKYIYERSTASYHLLFFPFYSNMVNILEEISNSLLSAVQFKDLSGYFNLLKNYLRSIRTPFEGIPLRGLQVLGFLETRNLSFKNIFFLDLNEEIFPPLYEDYILPLRVREALGLPTSRDREKLIEYYFRTLINGADKVYLFYVEDGKRERSRFIEKIIWDREKNLETITVKKIHYRMSLSAQKPTDIKKEEHHLNFLKDFLFSPSSIDVYLKCPIKFYYQYILGLREKKTKEVDAAEIGSIVHEVLAKFFRRFLNRKKISKRDLDIDLIRKITEEEFTRKYGNFISGSLFLIREQIIKRVSEIIQNYYGEVISKNDLSILAIEEPFILNLTNFSITGKIDIVEKRCEKTFVIDYKTSGRKDDYKIKIEKIPEIIEWYKNEKKEEYLSNLLSGVIASLQIPIYLLAISKQKSIPLDELVGIYLLIGKAYIDEEIEFNPFKNFSTIENPLEILTGVLEILIEEIKNPNIPFYATKNFERNCLYCEFQKICGTQWVN